MRAQLTLAALVSASAGCSLINPILTFGDGTDAGLTDGGGTDGGDGSDGGSDAGCPLTCGGDCVNPQIDPEHCGSCENACAAVDNGEPTCVDGSCDFRCNPGFEEVMGMCVERTAPRPVAPLSGATATSRRPIFRWELAPRSDGARIEICADRACGTVIRTVDVAGMSGAPPADLPVGIVFWRLYSRAGTELGTRTSPTWQLSIGARSATVDSSYGATADINGDGFADIIIGASGYSTPSVFVHHGSASGISTSPTTTLTGSAGFGLQVDSAGDVNGDGFVDLLIRGESVYVFHGSDAGLPAAPSSMITDIGSSGGGSFALGSVGDINADGYADIAIGDPAASSASGRVYVHLGGPDGVSATRLTTLRPLADVSTQFGVGIGQACDVDADGFADIVVGEPAAASSQGRMYVFYGTPSGPAVPAGTIINSPVAAQGAFGIAVACAGDVNGDGYADVVVGAQSLNMQEGAAYVFNGGPDGLSSAPASTIPAVDGVGGFFGWTVALGDVNGDGLSDIAVGAPRATSNTGRVHVYYGSLSGVGSTPSLSLTGPDGMNREFGRLIASGGDVHADGFSDLIVTTYTDVPSGNYVYVFEGGATGLSDTLMTRLTGRTKEFSGFGNAIAF